MISKKYLNKKEKVAKNDINKDLSNKDTSHTSNNSHNEARIINEEIILKSGEESLINKIKKLSPIKFGTKITEPSEKENNILSRAKSIPNTKHSMLSDNKNITPERKETINPNGKYDILPIQPEGKKTIELTNKYSVSPNTTPKNEKLPIQPEGKKTIELTNKYSVSPNTTPKNEKLPIQPEGKKTIELTNKYSVSPNTTPKNEKIISPPKKGEASLIPVLKTFHYDIQKLSRTKGGAELRSMLAKELEEKQKAQIEYANKTKDLLKESAILKEKQRNFFKKQKKDTVSSSSIDEKNINDAISGALDYMLHGEITKNNAHTKQKVDPDIINKKQSFVSLAPQYSAAPKLPLEKQTTKEKAASSKFSIRNPTNKENTLSKKRIKILQKQQEVIVEKEGLRQSLKEFEEKKRKLQDQGAKIRDARQFNISPIRNNILLKQNIVAVLVVIGLLVALGIIIYTIITQPRNITPPISLDDFYKSEDIINTNDSIFIDVSTSTDEWETALIKNRSATIQKFVPYGVENGEKVQISFKEFANLRNSKITEDFFKTLGPYYFIGKYSNKSGDTNFIILEIQNYNNALVLLPRLEKKLFQSISKIFPTFLPKNSTKDNIRSQYSIVNNKNIKTLTDVTSIENSLIYYFFNPSYLIIIVGNQNAIKKINEEIRNSNT